MRLTRMAGGLLGALAMVGGLAAPVAASPLDIEWRNDIAVKGYGQQLVVDPGTGDVLALLQSGDGNEVVRRFDARTGAVEWTLPAPAMTHLAVDPSSGHAVLAGWRSSRQVLMLVSAGGTLTREVVTDVTAGVLELVVDPTSGQVCTLGMQGRQASRVWATACWTATGEAVFADLWQPPAGTSMPSALAVDPSSHRVYAAGTSRPSAGRQKKVVLRAYDPTGALRWSSARRGAFMPGRLDIAVDPARGRIHLLNRPLFIQSPVQLFSFDDRGRLRASRSYEDLGSVYDTAVAVTRRGRLLTVATDAAHASLRLWSPSGRRLSATKVRIASDRRDNYLQEIAVDARRERVHLLVGGGDTPVEVLTFTFRGRRVSSVVVDRRNVIFGDITVDPATGRVLATTSLSQSPGQRVTALRG